MWIAWVLGAVGLVWTTGCGEIREVPVDPSDTDEDADEGDDAVAQDDGTTTASSTGVTTVATGPDQDTDDENTDDIGGDDAETGLIGDDWAIFCELAVDGGAVTTTTVTVKGIETAQDLRIGVRVNEGLLEPLRLTLEHGDVARVLADVDNCVAPTDFWFADDAAATPDTACESSTGMESMFTRPAESLAPLLRGNVEGDWVMTIERTGKAQWLGLGSVCIALLP